MSIPEKLRAVAACVAAAVCLAGSAAAQSTDDRSPAAPRATLADAQRLFYNAHYDETAAHTLALCASQPADLAVYELRTSALLFQIKRALGDLPTNDTIKRCAVCPPLVASFMSDTVKARTLARARLQANPGDEEARFFLGKIDLNYVWLQLGTLGRKTGWDQYWEARRSLDAVLATNPHHVRARVARAWIDYIVDTKMPRGTRWLLGGGDRERALIGVREAARADGDFFVRVESAFALWDMLVRERNLAEATVVARRLALDFPGNPELAAFLDKHDPTRGR